MYECPCIVEIIKQVREKGIKCEVWRAFIAFRNEFDKFNNTGARIQ